ncbi:hypothetical protein GCM10023172_11490 [Hymenobacter ginsengisoli]|uniref:SusE outer membrane protein domain-containing protein n=1 Tax=Hymenobacter ginsengisoli TaxID=1051626 RepID=A0ABP8Q3J0_9BACT|nr:MULTISPECIES: SusE domain-containing protein [unclassified Hymenobacter]MBO2031736.1 SusE domain-containing protein [Hymenobacter sp. BT559]
MFTSITRATAGLLTLALLGFSSCQKDETKVTLTPKAAPALSVATTTPDLVLSTANANSTGDTFTFTAADFGYQSATSYSLQIDKKGGDFSSPQSFDGGTSAGAITLTKAQLANAFFALGVPYGASGQVDARVVASVSPNATKQSSSVVTLSATPTPVCVPNTTGRTWSLIGPAGTDWGTDVALTYDCYSQTFKARLPLQAAEFKFRANNDWSVNFGTTQATTAITMSSLAQGITLTNGNNNLQITTAGTYNIVLAPSADGKSGTVTIKP